MGRNRELTACVVGGGIIGSWAALHLAEAGVATTLVEQFPLPHTRGSSHGMSRAFRLLGDDTLDRLDYSRDRWRSLEAASGQSLLVTTGLINFGPDGDPYLGKYMAVLEQGGREYAWLTSEEIASRYPMLRYPAEWGAVWDPSGGILFAYRCLSGVQSGFLAAGGRVLTGRVVAVEIDDKSGARVTFQTGSNESSQTGRFDRVVVAAGPWTAKLLPRLSPFLQSIATPVTYWRDPSGEYSIANGCPILFNARLTDVYALPSCEYPGLVKVLYHGGPEVDPDARDVAGLEWYIGRVSEYVREHLPLTDSSQPVIVEPCMYTMTPDGAPIIARLGPSLVVGCGFSGSGFKHSPATGMMLASLAIGDEDSLPEGFEVPRYRLDRF